MCTYYYFLHETINVILLKDYTILKGDIYNNVIKSIVMVYFVIKYSFAMSSISWLLEELRISRSIKL